MKKKSFIFLFCLLVLNSLVGAQTIQTLNCDALLDGTINSQTEYQELANICFYGYGYDDDVSLKLANDDNSYEIEAQEKNGVTSSLSGDLFTFFDDVVSGVYRLFVNDKIEYTEDIIVTGSEVEECNSEVEDCCFDEVCCLGDECCEDEKCCQGDDCESIEDVPEFSTLAALAVLGIAGVFISKKRQDK